MTKIYEEQINTRFLSINRGSENFPLHVFTDGTYRFILNLKELNDFIEAYYLILINKHRQYLRLSFGLKIYQFNCLSFEIYFTPYLFTKRHPGFRTLREQNILFLIYLDEYLLMDSSEENCRIALSKTLTLLCDL